MVNYESLLAPFYFKLGDFLLTYIMMNTDEMGAIKPMTFPDSDDEGEEEAGDEAKANEVEEAKEEVKEETKDEAEAGTQLINTSVPKKEVPANNEASKEVEEEENYEQEALNHFSTCLQIIGDFTQSEGVLEAERSARRKAFIYLEIDAMVRRAELSIQVSDYPYALTDLTAVEALCTEFPDKNESTLFATIFQKGKCLMDLQKREQALQSFKHA